MLSCMYAWWHLTSSSYSEGVMASIKSSCLAWCMAISCRWLSSLAIDGDIILLLYERLLFGDVFGNVFGNVFGDDFGDDGAICGAVSCGGVLVVAVAMGVRPSCSFLTLRRPIKDGLLVLASVFIASLFHFCISSFVNFGFSFDCSTKYQNKKQKQTTRRRRRRRRRRSVCETENHSNRHSTLAT